jgi:hypothetical protein
MGPGTVPVLLASVLKLAPFGSDPISKEPLAEVVTLGIFVIPAQAGIHNALN